MTSDLARMTRLLALGAVSVAATSTADAGEVGSGCTFNGVALKGDVEVVESFPDFKVKVVSSFPDLKVERVASFPDDCGQWRFVDSFPDFTVQFVDSFPDFTIQYVDSFPGVP